MAKKATKEAEKPNELTVDDATFEQELVSNERIIEHPTLGEIKLSRPTRRKQALIAEVRRKRWHEDLMNDAILSRDQVEERATRRGMWSETLTENMKELSRRVGELMGILDAVGYKSIPELIEEYNGLTEKLYEELSEKGQEALESYMDLELEDDASLKKILLKELKGTKGQDLLDEVDDMKSKISLLQDMAEARQELEKLQVRSVTLFADTIEARADRAEAVARMYYCATTPDGEYLWDSIDEIWDEDPELVDFLESEMFYFLNGLDPEFKESLQKYGFIRGAVSTLDEYEDSQDQPQSNSDGKSQEIEQTSSSDTGE